MPFVRRFFAIIVFAILSVLAVCDRLVAAESTGRIMTRLTDVPPESTAVVLGTSKYFHDHRNAFYDARMRAAADLFRAGRLSRIIVSGAAGSPEGNEPEQMRGDLISLGVPEDKIALDPQGTRTIESVINAHERFGLGHPVFISQRFHLERAIYLARGLSFDASGFAADDAPPPWRYLVRLREVISRAAAVLERYHGAPIFKRSEGRAP